MENSKNMWVVLGLVVVIFLGVFWYIDRDVAPEVVLENVEQTVEPTEDTSEGSVNVSTPAASISYQNALVRYKDSRIQIDESCQARPNNITYKNGTNIMIDNRSKLARTVKVGSIFPIKAWGFKIVKLESATLPATWLVDCDKSQNVATILIQK